jgi:hypothetical protein
VNTGIVHDHLIPYDDCLATDTVASMLCRAVYLKDTPCVQHNLVTLDLTVLEDYILFTRSWTTVHELLYEIIGFWCPSSSVSIVTRLRAGLAGFDSRRGQ